MDILKIIVACVPLLCLTPSVALADCEQVADNAWKCDPPTRPATPTKPRCHYFGNDYICNTDQIGQPVTRVEKVIEADNCKWRPQRDKHGVKREEHYCR